jgi:hypothetical protein
VGLLFLLFVFLGIGYTNDWYHRVWWLWLLYLGVRHSLLLLCFTITPTPRKF